MMNFSMSSPYVEPGRALKVAALACAVVAAALWVGPCLLRAGLYANDAAQHTFWLYRYADPGLFPGDLTVRFFSLLSSAPWGYRTLYAALAPHIDVLLAAKVVAVLLVLSSVGLGWLLGRALSPPAHRELGGLIAAAVTAWLIPQHADLLTPLGLQRSFAYPIVLLFLWALIAQRYFWVGIAWLAAALFYPVIVVVLGLTGAIYFVWEMASQRRLVPCAFWNIAAGLAALVIAAVSSSVPPDIGPALTGAQALAMPEFGFDGRLRLFEGNAVTDWVRSQLVGLGWTLGPLTLMALALALLVALKKSTRVPRAAWLLLACGVGVWGAARLTLFKLYLPNRHSRWAIAAFGVVVLTVAAVAIFEWLLQRLSARSAGISSTALTTVVGVLSVAIVAGAFAGPAWRQWQHPVDPDMERAYAYLATLPRDALIAAHPDVADFVPLRARRSVLASTETSLPFMQGYYARLKPRIEDSLRAAYAGSWDDLESVLAPYRVSAVLTAPQVWAQERYYEPFNSLVASLVAQGRERGFVLRHPPADRILFQSGEVYVVRVDAPPTLNGGTPVSATGRN